MVERLYLFQVNSYIMRCFIIIISGGSRGGSGGSPSPQGGTLNFSTYVGSGPSIYPSPPKNIRNFKHPQKILEILATQKISPFCTMTLRKDPKMHRNNP